MKILRTNRKKDRKAKFCYLPTLFFEEQVTVNLINHSGPNIKLDKENTSEMNKLLISTRTAVSLWVGNSKMGVTTSQTESDQFKCINLPKHNT